MNSTRLWHRVRTGVLNDHDLMTAWHDLRDTSGDLDAPWPAQSLHPVAGLPGMAVCARFLGFWHVQIHSRRFRDALAPARRRGTVPAVRSGPRQRGGAGAGLSLDARAGAPGRVGPGTLRLAGKRNGPMRSPASPSNPCPTSTFWHCGKIWCRAPIFGLDESLTYILVTDAVAGRVLRAGMQRDRGVRSGQPAGRQADRPLPHRHRHRRAADRVSRLKQAGLPGGPSPEAAANSRILRHLPADPDLRARSIPAIPSPDRCVAWTRHSPKPHDFTLLFRLA